MDAFTPDAETECDRKRPDNQQKNVMDRVLMGVDREQFERHIIIYHATSLSITHITAVQVLIHIRRQLSRLCEVFSNNLSQNLKSLEKKSQKKLKSAEKCQVR